MNSSSSELSFTRVNQRLSEHSSLVPMPGSVISRDMIWQNCILRVLLNKPRLLTILLHCFYFKIGPSSLPFHNQWITSCPVDTAEDARVLIGVKINYRYYFSY